jgi:hypothetical protein
MRDTGRIVLNGTPEEWSEFASHFGNIYREQLKTKELKDKDDKSLYGTEYVWKRNGPDHYVHTLAYAYIGFLRFGGGQAAIVSNQLNSFPQGLQGQEGYIPHTAFETHKWKITYTFFYY